MGSEKAGRQDLRRDQQEWGCFTIDRDQLQIKLNKSQIS